MADEQLVARLRSVLAMVDPTGPPAVARARQAYGHRCPAPDLLDVVVDSADPLLAGTALRSGGADARLLAFGAVGLAVPAERAVEVEIGRVGPAGTPVLVGQVVPPCAAAVRLQALAGAELAVCADGLGRFRLEPVPAGLIRIRVEWEPGQVAQTVWFNYLDE